ncbi:MAG: alkaline phosphatase family protein [Thermoguttaceae bacterium]
MKPLVFLSIPGLRQQDVAALPSLCAMTSAGKMAPLVPSFPAVTCPVQSNMTTGKRPNKHGVIANGFYIQDASLFRGRPFSIPKTVSESEQSDPCNVPPMWPKKERIPYVEMWTSPNSCIESPQIWDVIREESQKTGEQIVPRSAVWFALLSKYCSADNVCNFAPIHNPDGSESLWCYTRPYSFYGKLRDSLDHFPVKHYWGPIAGLPASKWIVDSAILEAKEFRPDFLFVYIPRLDYTPQKFGPNVPQLQNDLAELDTLLASMRQQLSAIYDIEPTWLIAGEYAMTEVDSVIYPNRILRELGLLSIEEQDGKEMFRPEKSRAFALCDHQFSHIFFNDNSPQLIDAVANRFRAESEIDEVLVGKEDLARYDLDHPRSGQIVLISKPTSWQSYYFWNENDKAPDYAKTVDIHRKPGYDPVELFFDRATMSVPLDASLIHGSHGAPVRDSSQKTVVISSDASLLKDKMEFSDCDIFSIMQKAMTR